ncbi:MAG: hypothetical protein EOP10_18760 [Proteobacteria bacterium]|nr:MAG: hypothetical protein EOP10_18760 [Pseudomonadota bacterium]
MKCPVPGCYNDRFDSGSSFCDACGMLTVDRYFVSSLVGTWENFTENPRDFCNRPDVRRSSFGDFFEMMSSLDEDLFSEMVNSVKEDLSPTYSSPSHFRVGHPTVRFFRCWTCDRKDAVRNMPPLMPPEKFAHSTMADDYLQGRRHNYELFDKLKSRRDKLENMVIPRPEPFFGNSNRLHHMLGRFGNVGNEYLAQMAEMTRVAEQQDAAENSRRENEYYRALEEKRRKIADLEREMSSHTSRPDARHHTPCPNCNSSFPFLLTRPSEGKYSSRSSENFNKPITSIEYFLWGDDRSPERFDALSCSQRRKAAIEYCAWECGIMPSMFYVVTVESWDGNDWKFLEMDDPMMEDKVNKFISINPQAFPGL